MSYRWSQTDQMGGPFVIYPPCLLLIIRHPQHLLVVGFASALNTQTVPHNLPYYFNFVISVIIFVVINAILDLDASNRGSSGW